MKRLIFILFLFMGASSMAQNEVDDPAFAKANQAYTAENYDLAAAGYEQILKTGKHSVELYFNLGNAYYKMNAVGPAIYNYEKALQMDADNEDVLNNLKFANQMKMDAVDSAEVDIIGSRLDAFITSLTVDEWAYTSILAVLFTILMAVFYFYAQTAGKKRLFFVLMFLGILLSALTISAAFYAKNGIAQEQYAIVYTEEFTTREEPKETATASFVIHEGTKVEVLEEFDGWSRIALSNGSKAWIKNDLIKKL